MKKEFNRIARYTSLLSLFLIVMLVYIVMLAKIQMEGAKNPSENDEVAYTRTVTVSGLRGEIYDRNGKLLVGNNTSYDLLLEYGAIPDTSEELNTSILKILDALDKTNSTDRLSNTEYIFIGTYPDISYTSLNNKDIYDDFIKILDKNKLEHSIEAKELVEYFVSKYKLSPKLYSNEEITSLLQIRYAMERIEFGVYNPLVFAEDISIELVSYIEEANIDGVTFKVSSERKYEYPGYASHILGRLGKIQAENAEYYSELGYPMDSYVGTSGCELAFEQYLRGQDGTMEISYDADGNIISKKFIKEPISGNDVYLTIDIELQITAEDALKKTVDALDYSDSGALVALDANDGGILVSASYPSYDISQFSSKEYYNSLLNDPAKPLLDRALLGEYAPGSIFKIGSALASLELGEISSTTRLNCSGTYPHLHQPTCLGVHGNINVINAIGVSCNCFFYEIGMRMGIDSITPYTTKLGLGVSTGIELPERTGLVAGTPSKGEAWTQSEDLSAVIGQSDHTYTPLQLAVFMSSVANVGDRYSAHLLHSVKKFYTEETVYEYPPIILDSIDISENTYSTLVSGMRNVITSSSNLTNYFSGVDVIVGGKTGTAQKNGMKDFALFAGVAPLDDPKIVSACVLEQGVNGANAAIPMAKVFEKYFNEDSDLS